MSQEAKPFDPAKVRKHYTPTKSQYIPTAVPISLKGKLSPEDMKPLAQSHDVSWDTRSHSHSQVIYQFIHMLFWFCGTGSYYVAQASFKLVIFLFQSPEC